MDSSNLTTCRDTGITKTVGNATEFRLCPNCGGYTHETVGNPSRTKYDMTVDNAVVEQPFVEQAAENNLTKNAFRCSHCGEEISNYATLTALAVSAQTLHDGATEGIASGNYAVGSKATLQSAITVATGIVTAEATTVAQTATAINTLQVAVEAFEAGIVA